MKIWKLLIPFCAVIIVGCASSGGTDDGSAGGAGGAGDGSSTSGVNGDGVGGATTLDAEMLAELKSSNIIYFGYDSANLDSASLELAQQHGAYIANNPDVVARLEGHADERGTREYNLGLGERRSVSVQNVLSVQGVAPEQLNIISFGEERPVNLASDDAAYAENRRVEIVYE
jgi:peptidoglycan-associated lipoprotein